MSNFHESTIAMSLYNVIAVGEATTLDEARASMARRGMLVGMNELELARDALVERGYAKTEDDRIGVTGPRGEVIVSRDRSGDGWAGWATAPARQRERPHPLVSARA